MIHELSASIRLTERARIAGYNTAAYDAAQAVYAHLRDSGDPELAEDLYQVILALRKKAPPRR